MSKWKLTEPLRKEIYKWAQFPQSPVLLRQMVQFGPRPNPGLLFRALQFICEELPIRLAHKVKDLENSPLNLREFAPVMQVRDWYAQLFEELIALPKPPVLEELARLLYAPGEEDGLRHPAVNDAPLLEQLSHSNKTFGRDDEFLTDDGIVIPRHLAQRQHVHHHLIMGSGRGDFDGPQVDYRRKYYSPVPPELLNVMKWPSEVSQYISDVSVALRKIKKRHDATVATMAQGVQEWKLLLDPKNKSRTADMIVEAKMQNFLDRFYMLRIGIRMLIGQHVALLEAMAKGTSVEDFVGIICTDLNLRHVLEDGIDNALYICDEHYGLFLNTVPVELHCPEDLLFMYVPGHLIHMIFETVKNLLRATVEFQLKQQMAANPGITSLEDVKFPPIKVIVLEGYEDITIKISDEGGGIPRLEVPLVWQYLYTTVDETPLLEQDQQQNFRAPMAGFGYGLPILRLYARYFGGLLNMISMEGYGTDVYLHLNRLSSSSEPLQ